MAGTAIGYKHLLPYFMRSDVFLSAPDIEVQPAQEYTVHHHHACAANSDQYQCGEQEAVGQEIRTAGNRVMVPGSYEWEEQAHEHQQAKDDCAGALLRLRFLLEESEF